MNSSLAKLSWPACLSALQLDRLRLGELSGAAHEEARAHVAGCAACSAALGELSSPEPLPPLRAAVAPLSTAPAPRVLPLRRRALLGGAGLAAAASLLLIARMPAHSPGERLKGSAPLLSMYVQHNGDVRRAGPGATVDAGDAVRFSVTTKGAAYVAVLSVDPRGKGSVYFPLAPRAELLPAGQDVALPVGTRLDSTVGDERVIGLFCSSPVELEPVRQALERGQDSIPEGCQVTRWSFVKR
jgi:hypothetical protein